MPASGAARLSFSVSNILAMSAPPICRLLITWLIEAIVCDNPQKVPSRPRKTRRSMV